MSRAWSNVNLFSNNFLIDLAVLPFLAIGRILRLRTAVRLFLDIGRYLRSHTEVSSSESELEESSPESERQNMSQCVRFGFFSYRWPANAQTSLCIRAVSPEHSLLAHIKYPGRQWLKPKIKSQHCIRTGQLYFYIAMWVLRTYGKNGLNQQAK